MRIFNLISSWLLWLLCVLYALTVFALRILNTTPRPEISPEKLARYVRTFWLALAMVTAFAAGAYFFRRRFWFMRGRPPGLGFWIVTVFFYLSVLFVTAAGFAPFFAGDRSVIQWASCALGAVFIVLGFPRLPQPAAIAPSFLKDP